MKLIAFQITLAIAVGLIVGCAGAEEHHPNIYDQEADRVIRRAIAIQATRPIAAPDDPYRGLTRASTPTPPATSIAVRPVQKMAPATVPAKVLTPATTLSPIAQRRFAVLCDACLKCRELFKLGSRRAHPLKQFIGIHSPAAIFAGSALHATLLRIADAIQPRGVSHRRNTEYCSRSP